MRSIFKNKAILITGATGFFVVNCLKEILLKGKPKKVIVYSRDEMKQFELSKIYHERKYPVRYFLGDIRDKERLVRACYDIDIIIHAAAMKQVPAAEYNPTECIATTTACARYYRSFTDSLLQRYDLFSWSHVFAFVQLAFLSKKCLSDTQLRSI